MPGDVFNYWTGGIRRLCSFWFFRGYLGRDEFRCGSGAGSVARFRCRSRIGSGSYRGRGRFRRRSGTEGGSQARARSEVASSPQATTRRTNKAKDVPNGENLGSVDISA